MTNETQALREHLTLKLAQRFPELRARCDAREHTMFPDCGIRTSRPRFVPTAGPDCPYCEGRGWTEFVTEPGLTDAMARAGWPTMTQLTGLSEQGHITQYSVIFMSREGATGILQSHRQRDIARMLAACAALDLREEA